MKINRSYIIAALLFIIIGLWFAVNTVGKDDTVTGKTQAQTRAEIETSSQKPTVQVRNLTAQSHDIILELYGQSEASREVDVKAQTAGLIVATPVAEGRILAKDTLLCRQDIDARQAILDQALANKRTIETDLNAARILAKKGYQSSSRVTAFEAQMDGAKAGIKQAQIELDNVNMRAPFGGIWERQHAQVGDYLAPGQACGLLVDLSPLHVVVQLTEDQVRSISKGDTASVSLATGQNVTAAVAFIEAKADPATRTFRTVMHVPNNDFTLKAGVTATVRLKAGEALAHQIPSNILTLNDEGLVGIRYLDEANIVRFSTVKTIDENANGVWVTGLPEIVRIITEGQSFVAEGMEAIPDSTYGNSQFQNTSQP
ncbi:MAG: efflux RND transporter periplasmic adaptor subunit [Litorimonas sp.]